MTTEATNEEILARTVAAINVAMRILSVKVLTLLALLMTFGLFSWAMVRDDALHFAVAGAFGAGIFLPILWFSRGEGHG